MEPFVILNNNLIYIVLSLTVIIILLSIFCIIMFFRLKNIEKKYNFFSSDGFTDKNLEENILRYIEDVRDVKSKYSKTLKYIQDIDKNIQRCTQKVGIVRYNPFDEVGGKLCFSVAMLDNDDNGVVLTGIHSRTGSFTYAKPIEMGISPYYLSEEEIEAIRKAQDDAYKSLEKNFDELKNTKTLKVKFRPKREKYIKNEKSELSDNDNIDNNNISCDDNNESKTEINVSDLSNDNCETFKEDNNVCETDSITSEENDIEIQEKTENIIK